MWDLPTSVEIDGVEYKITNKPFSKNTYTPRQWFYM